LFKGLALALLQKFI